MGDGGIGALLSPSAGPSDVFMAYSAAAADGGLSLRDPTVQAAATGGFSLRERVEQAAADAVLPVLFSVMTIAARTPATI